MTELYLGDLDLMGDGLFRLEALGTDSGTNWGNPVPIESQLNSFVQYGALVTNEGWENMPVMVALSGSDSDAVGLAQLEAALAAEVGKPNWLKYTPHGSDVATWFEVRSSHFDAVPDDLREVTQCERLYMLNLTCAPFKFSANETTTPALPASGTTTATVDDMSAATGWTATVGGATVVTPSAASGVLTAAAGSPIGGEVTIALTRVGSIATSSTKYLALDWKVGAGASVTAFGMTATADGHALALVSSQPSPTAGYVRNWFQVGTGVSAIASLTFAVNTYTSTSSPSTRSVSLDLLTRTDVRPSLGSIKQQLRTIEVGGSAPTTGSLLLAHATAALGETWVYTCPDDGIGYTPCLTNYRSAGTLVADSAAVTGSYVDINASNLSYSVPSTAIPDGEYLVVARMRSTTNQAVPVIFAGYPAVNGNGVLPGATPSISTTVSLASSYKFFNLGMIHLPLMYTDPTAAGAHVFGLTRANSSYTNVYVDEVYLFNLVTGDLTVADCGSSGPASGGPSRRLWIDSPSLDNDGVGNLVRGHAADRSDGFSAFPYASAAGVHEFKPGNLTVLTVCTNPATAADASFRYRAAWVHTAAS